MQSTQPYIQKIHSFPKNAETLLLFEEESSKFVIFVMTSLIVFFLFVLNLPIYKTLPSTIFSTLLFIFILCSASYTLVRHLFRIASKKNICLAKDQDWLYIDQFDPKKIKLDQIKEIQVIKSTFRMYTNYYLAFEMKDGQIVGKDSITWWPTEKLPFILEKHNLPVVQRNVGGFYVFKHMWR